MDERQLARLVDEVKQAFPDDPVAQRDAWEFLEAFMDAWDEAGAGEQAIDPAGATDRPGAITRLLAACRRVLDDAAGRVVRVLDDLVPADPAVALSDPDVTTTITLDGGVAAELGVQAEITVEIGETFVTLNAEIDESSAPERLAAVLLVAGGPEETLIERFTRADARVAAAHFDIAPGVQPLALALVVFDPYQG